MAETLSLFDDGDWLPEGFLYVDDVLSEQEESGLLHQVEGLDFSAVVMHGVAARRTTRHYGYGYEFQSQALTEADPLPDWLVELRDRVAASTGEEPAQFVEALVTRYPPGATMGWHRDAPGFGDVVLGVSLGARCRLRFQRGKGPDRVVAEQLLEPRSVYALKGAARWLWQHSIPAVKETRYSVTFRTLRRPRANRDAPA